jgi:hypothetical protein
MHKSTHILNDATLAHKQIYQPPPTGNVYYYDFEEMERMHRKPHTPNPHQQNKGDLAGQYYTDVNYIRDDCPWTPQEIEAFNPFPTHPPIQHHNTPNPPFKTQPPAKEPNFNLHNQHTNFSNQLQSQHRMVSKGPKLSFPEFDGTDPDGWIRKADKYFDLVGVSNEDRV